MVLSHSLDKGTSMSFLRSTVVFPVLTLAFLLGMSLVADTATAQPQTVHHGNVQSHIYHRQGCRFFDCKACSAAFKTKEEAEKSVYRPCKVCKL